MSTLTHPQRSDRVWLEMLLLYLEKTAATGPRAVQYQARQQAAALRRLLDTADDVARRRAAADVQEVWG